MSNTRYHDPDLPLDPNTRQSAGFSSAEYERGLLANAVARRCTVLKNPADRELLMFVQYLSLEQGSLSALAKELIALFPQFVATNTMRKFGTKPGKIYNADQVREIRLEFPEPSPSSEYVEHFPMKGDRLRHMGPALVPPNHFCWQDLTETEKDKMLIRLENEKERQAKLSSSYPAEKFLEFCRNAAEKNLESELESLCLHADWKLDESGPWFFPKLVDALREYQTQWVESRKKEIVETEVVSKISEELDHCLDTGEITLVEGESGIGKQFPTESLCALQPGRVRCVQTSPMPDEGSFFRGIGRDLGVSIATSLSVAQIKARIESTLRDSGIGLAFHDAQFLFIASTHREIMYKRVNWLVTLVNSGVPIFLSATPQFLETVKGAETVSRWNSAQLTKKLRYAPLPSVVSRKDLTAVAKHMAPNADANSIRAIVAYASTSGKFIAGIVAMLNRAKSLAKRKGHVEISDQDLIAAYESVAPSAKALSEALTHTGRAGGKMRRVNPPQSFEAPRRADLSSEPETISTREIQPLEIQS